MSAAYVTPCFVEAGGSNLGSISVLSLSCANAQAAARAQLETKMRINDFVNMGDIYPKTSFQVKIYFEAIDPRVRAAPKFA
jgi:hypothetical protein